jgi:hypothetical protein
MTPKAQILEREKRWSLPAGISAVFAVVIYLAGQIVGRKGVGAPDGMADFLTKVSGHHSSALLGGILQGLGLALLAAPLLYLFFAALARSDRMKRGLMLVMIIGPALVGLGSIFSTLTLLDASDEWQGDATPGVSKCFEDAGSAEGSSEKSLTEDEKTDCRDDAANDLRDDQSLVGPAVGLSLAGALGFLVGLMYTSLYAMRTGLLSRFWGSLGMAVGVLLILPGLQFIILGFFVYLGLLFAGWVPRRPPAWAAGEAIPWPKPGDPEFGDDDGDVIEGTADELDPDDSDPHGAVDAPDALDVPDPQGAPDGPDAGPQGERRKRKKRN